MSLATSVEVELVDTGNVASSIRGLSEKSQCRDVIHPLYDRFLVSSVTFRTIQNFYIVYFQPIYFETALNTFSFYLSAFIESRLFSWILNIPKAISSQGNVKSKTTNGAFLSTNADQECYGVIATNASHPLLVSTGCQ